jgi:mannose-6-phosphate isomerase-like protein (cupin superfamily)
LVLAGTRGVLTGIRSRGEDYPRGKPEKRAGTSRAATTTTKEEKAAMAGYTRVNLKEVEDQAPKFGLAPNIEARFASVPLELQKSGMSYQRLAPNFRAPFGHTHKTQEELYVIVGGSARVKLDDEIVELKRWDAVRVPPDTTRCFEAGPEGVEILAFGAPRTGASLADAEMKPNWWTD